MNDLTIRDVFDLPLTVPRCIVKIVDFDDEKTLQAVSYTHLTLPTTPYV